MTELNQKERDLNAMLENFQPNFNMFGSNIFSSVDSGLPKVGTEREMGDSTINYLIGSGSQHENININLKEGYHPKNKVVVNQDVVAGQFMLKKRKQDQDESVSQQKELTLGQIPKPDSTGRLDVLKQMYFNADRLF